MLSGTPGSAIGWRRFGRPVRVVEIKNRMPGEGRADQARHRRNILHAPGLCGAADELRRGDVVLTVTAPFMLPYAVAAAARLKRARSVLIMHDLFPDVLVDGRPAEAGDRLAQGDARANALMFRALTPSSSSGATPKSCCCATGDDARPRSAFIPNWATLAPGVRPIRPDNPYRRRRRPASSSGFPAIWVLPTIPSSCSRRHDCCGTILIFISCCRAGGSASIG